MRFAIAGLARPLVVDAAFAACMPVVGTLQLAVAGRQVLALRDEVGIGLGQLCTS